MSMSENGLNCTEIKRQKHILYGKGIALTYKSTEKSPGSAETKKCINVKSNKCKAEMKRKQAKITPKNAESKVERTESKAVY